MGRAKENFPDIKKIFGLDAFNKYVKLNVKERLFWGMGWLLYEKGLLLRLILCGVVLRKAGMEREMI